jgi:uncharacterized protein involved in exopolysaccharide biosynthesis
MPVKNTWSLEDLYTSVAREWRVLLIFTLVFLGAAYGADWLWPQRYESVAVQTVEPIATTQTSGSGGEVNMDTERVVATSNEVLALAAKQLPGASLDDLAESIEVTVPKGAQVLVFTYTASTPEQAAKGANAIAKAYSERRVATAQSVVNDAAQNLTDRISDLTAQLATLPPDGQAAKTLAVQIQTLQERQATLASTTFYSGSLISPAIAPNSSTKPGLAVFLAAGLFLGLFLGAFGALIRARRRRTVELSRELELPLPDRVTIARESHAPSERVAERPRGRTRG